MAKDEIFKPEEIQDQPLPESTPLRETIKNQMVVENDNVIIDGTQGRMVTYTNQIPSIVIGNPN